MRAPARGFQGRTPPVRALSAAAPPRRNPLTDASHAIEPSPPTYNLLPVAAMCQRSSSSPVNPVPIMFAVDVCPPCQGTPGPGIERHEPDVSLPVDPTEGA